KARIKAHPMQSVQLILERWRQLAVVNAHRFDRLAIFLRQTKLSQNMLTLVRISGNQDHHRTALLDRGDDLLPKILSCPHISRRNPTAPSGALDGVNHPNSASGIRRRVTDKDTALRGWRRLGLRRRVNHSLVS